MTGFVFIVCLLIFASDAHAGFLYVLRQQDGAANQIYGYSVNETNGSLTLLAGFPMSSGGNGIASTGNFQMTIDRANQRLYVVNTGSFTVSALSINSTTGALTPLPFSPLGGLSPSQTWSTVDVHPAGSPVVVGSANASPAVVSFKITATSGSTVSGLPLTTGNTSSIAFSRDGNFVYAGGGATNTFAGLRVDSKNAFLFSLPNSPFDSGAGLPSSYTTDSEGRLFMTNALTGALRAFTIVNGIPTPATGNPFASGLGFPAGSVLHPNENFLFVADRSGSRVGAFQISGNGAATTLAPVAGSPVNSGGSETNAVALNAAGNFLYATNNASRNLTTYGVNPSTGALSFSSVQAANTLGASGTITGIAYQPSVFTVTNINNSGAGSLRQAVQDASAMGGGVVVFDPTFFAVPRTIAITSGGQISIGSNISIVGPGANLLTVRNTMPAGSSIRVFNTGSGNSVSLSGMTITGGNVTGTVGGGGISNNFPSSILMVRECTISGNTAAGFGGGILNAGTLNILASTISGNISNGSNPGGGGIDSLGPTFVTSSTISGNIKNVGASGGGIFIGNAPLTITNSTITNNTGNGGAGGVFDGSGGGSPVLLIRNSIIAGNHNNPTVPDVAGSFTSGGFNLIGNVGAATGFNQTGDQIGNGVSPLNPGLVEVLAPNGGAVPTHALLPNSPALDKGNSSNLLIDQRGFGRTVNHPAIPNTTDGTDIGAFERRLVEPNVTAPFDFDGDGKTDIGIYRPLANAEWWINRSSDGTTFAAQFGTGSIPIVPADYTGDGKADIAIWRPAEGTWFILRSEDFSFFSFPFGQNNDIPASADYDGDTKADAAVYRPSAATWFILNSSGVTRIEQFGASEDRPVPADYDGDGRADIAIYRPSVGQWWMNRSTAGVLAVSFGVSSDKQVQGDYTGDGKSDVAFWRPSTGEWFVLRSEDFSFFSFPFGTATDVPAPGDYDGDGRHDATVFRPSNATWFSQRTNAGTLIQPFGVATDRPIANAFVR